MSDLADRRQWFAEEVALRAGSDSEALKRAFAAVPRERFLGPPPWRVLRPSATPSGPLLVDDPGMLYHCVLVAIDPERNLNNGEPSSLAMWIDALRLEPGDTVVHLGCGVGYYTAVMAELVGPTGRVVGFEVDPGLAERARANLADRANVEVIAGDGADVPQTDALFVNAGCTHPRAEWLARLRPGGRICLPLTVDAGGRGAMVQLHRLEEGWAARTVSAVAIFPCEGARDPAENEAVLALLRLGSEGAQKIRSMRLDGHERDDTCLLHASRYCLSSAAPGPIRTTGC